jgi:hypothetical protein
VPDLLAEQLEPTMASTKQHRLMANFLTPTAQYFHFDCEELLLRERANTEHVDRDKFHSNHPRYKLLLGFAPEQIPQIGCQQLCELDP